MTEKTPPYIINLIHRDIIDVGTVDILSYFSKAGHIEYLKQISHFFAALSLPDRYDCNQLYFIAQDDFNAIKVGLTRCPMRRLVSLQTGNPHRLIMLFYYDPVKFGNYSFGYCLKGKASFDYERHFLSFLPRNEEDRLMGEWIKPDDRSFRILIRRGLSVLEDLDNE